MHTSDIESNQLPDGALEAVPDETVIKRIREGDTRAYEIIMRRYNQRLFRAARSILKDNDAAQDAVQEAYISASLKLDSYAPTGSFGAWLTRITVNEALMIKRKPDNRVADGNNPDAQDGVAAAHADPVEAVANRELASLIEIAIDRLPDEFRRVFMLRAVQQLSVKETADSLSIPLATVKTRFHRARNLMQEQLNHHIESAGLQVFEFAGERCDRIVEVVLERLGVDFTNSDERKSFH
jgi:RNA polymerase sigma-70 factor (ECF subfamily)